MSLYSAYALNIDSELCLPELLPSTSQEIDLIIRYGEIHNTLPDYPQGKQRIWKAQPNKLTLSVNRIGRFSVVQGKEILIDPAPQASDEDLRFVVLGSLLGALLHQRNLLALHASAIQMPQGVVLFMGASGHGKSTLMATLAQRGYGIISDDVVAIRQKKGRPPMALPAFPRLRLWEDSVTQLGYARNALSPMRKGMKKYLIPVEHFVNQTLPVHGIYILDRCNQTQIHVKEAMGIEKFNALKLHTYRENFLSGLGLRSAHYEQIMSLANHVKMSHLVRPISPFQPQALADRVEMDWGDAHQY